MLTFIMVISCDDDDCAPCPTYTTPLAWTNGYANLDSYMYFYTDIMSHGGADPNIDSVKVDDSLCNLESSYYYTYGDPYYYASFDEDSDGNPEYVSGDTAVFTMYGDNRSSTCRLVLLDYYDDEADMIIPDDGDTTLTYGESFTCVWTKVDNAEWYGLELNYQVDSSGSNKYINIYTYTTDTTYTIGDTLYGYPVERVYFYALPTTGPNPATNESNWVGDLCSGKLYSYSYFAWVRVYFESASKVSGQPGDLEQKEKPVKSAKEIIQKINETYKK